MKDQKLEAGAFRQGDCFLVRVDTMPDGLVDITPERGRIVLMAGEATGHHHAFYDGGVKIFAPAGSPKSARPSHLQVVKTAYLKHEEHSPASLPPGLYRMPTQVEHSDDMEPRVVED